MRRPTLSEAYDIVNGNVNSIDMTSSRGVYINPTYEWVYKFEDYQQNESEYKLAKFYYEHPEMLPEMVRVPEVVLLDDEVLAMQYIDGEHPPECATYDGNIGCYVESCKCSKEMLEHYNGCWRKHLHITEAFGYDSPLINDCHNRNVLIDKNYYIWIIDLGYGSNTINYMEEQ